MKAKSTFLRHLTVLLALIVGLSVCASVSAEEYTAATMRLLAYEGTVEITDAAGNARFVLENARFNSGEAMSTGADSSATVGLDDGRTVILGADTRVEFFKEGGHTRLTLRQGTLMLDVQQKLTENESLDIEVSTMTAGIRGTVVFAQFTPDASDKPAAVFGVLEGVAHLSYTDSSEAHRLMDLPAGQKAVIPAQPQSAADSTPVVTVMTPADVEGFVLEQVAASPVLIDRITTATDFLDETLLGEEASTGEAQPPEDQPPTVGNEMSFPADGDWSWTGTVTLVAQSASKLYDASPLTRSSDVLVYGLPSAFSIHVAAKGSQTDAGSSTNSIAGYSIFNAEGENVTSHFPSIETVDGVLTVDPAPLTIWTGSAEKIYDGEPLTCPEAEIRTVPGYVSGEPTWRNTSIITTTSIGSETMYAASGVLWVHGSNPITGETQEIELFAGQRLTVRLNNEDSRESIEFQVETMTVEELPDEILRLYAANPELMAQACEDTGWDPELLAERIAALPEIEGGTELVEQSGLMIPAQDEDALMIDSTNVRITIDSGITNYTGRALGSDEAHFTPVRIPSSVVITATGSQTEPGESDNTYEIDWGGTNPDNYILKEDLGTLKVLPLYEGWVTLTAGSAEKVYDGTPLTNFSVQAVGLPAGFTMMTTVAGSQTDAGEGENKVTSYTIYDAEGTDVTAQFPRVRVESGTLTVSPAPLTVTTGSAEKVYDGTPLTAEEATLTGLIADETAGISATGSQTGAGESDNTYAIEWGTAKAENYTVTSETLGTLRVEALSLAVNFGGASVTYNGAVQIPSPTVTYQNGSHAGEAVTGVRLSRQNRLLLAGTDPVPLANVQSARFGFTLFTGDTVEITISGMGTDVGSYTLTGTVSTSSGNIADFDMSFSGAALTVEPAVLTIVTGSAAKPYDGTPLTCGEVTVTGAADGDVITVTPIGTVTEVGKTENTYTIDWGEVKSGNYAVTATTGTLEVTANDTPVTVTAASVSRPYDGKTLSDSSFTVEGLPAGFTCEAAVSGAQHDPGSTDNMIGDITIRDGKGTDVTAFFTDITAVNGTLTVTANSTPITVTAGDYTKVYDGEEIGGWVGVTVEGLPEGIEYMADCEFYASDAVTKALHPYFEVLDPEAAGDPTSYFTNITYVDGTLTVKPAPLTITTASAEKAYDGTALTAPVTVTGLVPADEDKVTVTATGTITDAGTVSNAYSIDWGTVKSTNYTLTEKLGTLTVSPIAISVDILDTEYTFDNAYHFVDVSVTCDADFTAEFLGDSMYAVNLPGARLSMVFRVTAKSKDACITELSFVSYGFTYGNPNNFDLTVSGGTLTVHPAPITITTGSATKVFDGTPLTCDEVTVTGFPGSESIVISATGTITDAGSTDNTYVISDWNGWNPDNYSVTEELGTLTVDPLPVTLSMENGSYPYYGEFQGVAVNVTSPNPDFELIREPQSTTDPHCHWHIDWGWGDSLAIVLDGCRDVGTYTISHSAVTGVGSTNAANYSITWTRDTVTFTVARMSLHVYPAANRMSRDLSAAPVTPTQNDLRLQYQNSLKGGEYITPDDFSYADGVITAHFTLFSGDEVIVTSSGWAENGIGSHTVTTSGSIVSGNPDNFHFVYFGNNSSYTISFSGTVTVTADSASKLYDGTPLTAAGVTAAGLPSGYTCTGTASGSRTAVGSSENTVTAYTILDAGGNDVTDRFPNVTTVAGTLTVTPNDTPITVTSADASGVYSPFGLRKAEYTVEGLPAGFTLTAEVTGEQTVGGSSPNTIASYTITDGNGEDVTAFFTNVSLVEGTLTLAKDKINMWSVSETFIYDGTYHSAHIYYQGARGSENPGTQISYSNVEALRNVGTVDATFTPGPIRTDLQDKYEIGEVSFGMITVEPAQLSFSMSDVTADYTGEYVVPEVTLTYLNGSREGQTVSPTSTTVTGGTAVLTYKLFSTDTVTLTLSGLARDAGTHSVTGTLSFNTETAAGNYTVSAPSCTVTIQPIAAAISTGSGSKTFDGSALTVSEASITGLLSTDEGEVTITAAGTITDAGSTDNTYTISWGSVNPDNYTVIEELGTLTVDPLPVTLSMENGSYPYYGEFQGVAVNVTSPNPDFELIREPQSTTDPHCHWHIDWGWGDSLAIVLDGCRDVGTYTISHSAVTGVGSTNAANYSITWTRDTVTFTVARMSLHVYPAANRMSRDLSAAPVTPTQNDLRLQYQNSLKGGEYITPDDFSYADGVITAHFTLFSGDEVIVTSSGWAENGIGSHTVTTSGSIVSGNPDNFHFVYFGNNSSYTISFSGTVTVTADSASKLYDGTPLTAAGVTAAGLPSGYTCTGTASGSRTAVGSSENTVTAYTILDAGGNDVTDRFPNVTTVAGTLTVTPNDTPITVTSADASGVYSPFGLRKAEYTVEGLPAGFTLTAEVTGEQTVGGSSPNTIASYTITDGNGEDVTAFFTNVSLVEGTLTLAKDKINMWSVSETFIYDGTYHSAHIYYQGARGSENPGTQISYSNVEALRNVGTVDATFTPGPIRTDLQDKYEIGEVSFGMITVEPAQLSFSMSDVTADYTGEYVVPEVTLTYLNGSREGQTVSPTSTTVTGGTAVLTYKLFSTDTVTLTLSGLARDAGTHSVTGTLSFNTETAAGNYTVSAPSCTVTIQPIAAAISTGSGSKTFDGSALTVSEASITGLLSTDEGEVTITAAGTITDAGSTDNTYTISWGSVNPDNYTVTEELGTLTVTPLGVLFDLDCSYMYEFFHYHPQAVPYDTSGTYAGGGAVEKVSEDTTDGHWTAVYNLTGGGQVQLDSDRIGTEVGTYELIPTATMLAGKAENYDIAYTNNEPCICPLDVEFYLAGGERYVGDNTVYMYDGTFHGARFHVYTGHEYDEFEVTKLSATQWRIAWDGGDVTEVTVTGGGTEIGEYPLTCTYTFTSGSAANYYITLEETTLLIAQDDRTYTFTATSASKTYDGTPLTGSGYTFDGYLSSGYRHEAVLSGSRTDAGSGEVGFAEIHIYKTLDDGSEVDVTDCVHTETVSGTLTVNPAPLTISTPTLSKTYDGSPLEGGEATVTGLAGGDAITVTTSSVTEAGTVDNEYTIDWGSVNSANYTVTDELGTLTVNSRPITFTVSGTRVYNGQNQVGSVTVSGVEGASVYQSSENSWTVEFTDGAEFRLLVEGGGKDVGTHNCYLSLSSVSGADNYQPTLTDGTVTITPAPLTIATGSKSAVFSGNPLTSSEKTVTGLMGTDEVDVSPNGIIWDAGSVDNVYDITWLSGSASNYTITENLGTLTVEPLRLIANLHGMTVDYGTMVDLNNPTMTCGNGDHAGETVSGSQTTPTSHGDVTFTLPNGDTVRVAVNAPSETAAGTYTLSASATVTGSAASNYIISYTGNTHTIKPLAITIRTQPETKVYDGLPLPESTDRPTVIGTFVEEDVYVDIDGTTITDAGEVTRGYSIEWGSADPANYTITEDLGTLTIERLQLQVFLGGFTGYYDSEDTLHYTTGPYTPELTYRNGPYEGTTVSPSSNGDGILTFNLYTGETLTVSYGGYDGEQTPGNYKLQGTASFSGGSASNFTVSYTGQVIINSAP